MRADFEVKVRISKTMLWYGGRGKLLYGELKAMGRSDGCCKYTIESSSCIDMIDGEDGRLPRNLAIRHGRGVGWLHALVTTIRYTITSHPQTSHCGPVTSADSVTLHAQGSQNAVCFMIDDRPCPKSAS